MIVPKSIVGKILRGEATMVYRLATTRRPRLGERLFVKSKSSEPVACHVLVTSVTPAVLGGVSFADARACGFRTRDDFKAVWVAAHDKAWVERWEASAQTTPEGQVVTRTDLARFDARWSHASALILSFTLDHSERPRLLADRNARADYVESPGRALSDPDPGEAVDIATQTKFSREGHQGFVARERARELDRENLTAEERMRLVRIDARAQGVSIEHLEAQIMGRIRAAERKVHNRKAA